MLQSGNEDENENGHGGRPRKRKFKLVNEHMKTVAPFIDFS